VRPKDPKQNERGRNMILWSLIGVLVVIALIFVVMFATM